MNRCDDCKIVLESDVRFCPQCGKPVNSGLNVRQQLPDIQVNSLLTSANLNRIRENWDKAIEDTTEALKLDPNNADIASLLGCIYEERGMPDQAVEWYQTALELNPGSTADKARLERVQALVPVELTDSFGKFVKHSRFAAVILASAFVLMIIAAVVVIAARSRVGETTATKPPTAQAPAPDLSGAPTHAVTAPRTPTAPPSRAKTVDELASSNTKGRAVSGARTLPETYIKGELSSSESIQATNASIDDVIADPRSNVVIVTFSLSARGQVTKLGITRAAVAVARTVFASNQQAQFVTTRCILSSGSADTTQVAFVGDVARSTIEALSAQPADQQLESSFTRPWWNPQIKQ